MSQVGLIRRIFVALAVVALLVARALLGAGENFGAFGYGLALFAGNFILLVALGRRLFVSSDGVEPSAEVPKGRINPGFLILFSVKIAFLGVGAYVGLALMRYPVLWFMIGVIGGLALLTFASLVLFQRFRAKP